MLGFWHLTASPSSPSPVLLDRPLAVSWLRRAADGNDMHAAFALAQHLEHVQSQPAEAHKYCMRAAEQGHALAQVTDFLSLIFIYLPIDRSIYIYLSLHLITIGIRG